MTKDEALKLALEALESPWNAPYVDGCDLALGKRVKAIIAIKEALVNEALEKMAENARELGLDYEPAQEPVTWRYKIVDVFGRPAWTLKTPKSDTRVLESQPLYTTPPQRTWIGLTLDERIELAQNVDWAAGAYCEYAEKIEAKLKEKNT